MFFFLFLCYPDSQNYTRVQVGLSLFQQLPSPQSVQYEVRTYNFYICPRSFASVDERFVCQASSLEFLTRYGFDFNKFIYLGIPSLSRDQEGSLRRDLDHGALFRALDRNIPVQDEDGIREICGELAAWSSRAKEGERQGPRDIGLIVPLVLHTEVRQKFPTLWSFAEPDGFYVEKVSPVKRKELDSVESSEQLQEQLLDSMLGFTKVFRHLSQAGLPIVGHNCLLDLLKMFRQFERDLPPSYEEFKRELHRLFPRIFDTKHICYELKKRLSKGTPHLEKILASSNLNLLHQLLGGNSNQLHSPRLVVPEGFSRYAGRYLVQGAVPHYRYEGQSAPHEAGYDALLAGTCFLGLAHMVS